MVKYFVHKQAYFRIFLFLLILKFISKKVYCEITYSKTATEPCILELQQKINSLENEIQELKRKSVCILNDSSKIYGFFKLDILYDTNRTDSGNFIRWVQNKTTKDSQINITTKATRIGILLEEDSKSPFIEKIKSQLEIDFYGINGPENRAYPQLRHAYCSINTHSNWQILFGQTSDLISQLNPNQYNYSVGYHAGNLAYRVPQLRISKFYPFRLHKLALQFAISRKIGSQTPFSSVPDTGSDFDKPVFQSRIEYSFPTLSNTSSSIAVWSHKGKEEFDFNKNYDKMFVDTSSLGFELNLNLSKDINIRGEIWKGENLDQFMGGIAQGYTMTVATMSNNSLKILKAVNAPQLLSNYELLDISPIKACGGWLELNVGSNNKLKHCLGLSIDDPQDTDLTAGSRNKNTHKWYNTTYEFSKSIILGLEYIYSKTNYLGEKNSKNHRYTTSMMYKF